jgi:periplasmic copper chaperone A
MMKKLLLSSLVAMSVFAFAPAHAGVASTLVAAAEHHHHHDAAEVKVGGLSISNGYIKATLPGQPVAGGFVTVRNDGSADDRLVTVKDVAGIDHVEIHEMSMNGDVMIMRKLPDGLPVPAGETVELRPGGLHLMLIGVKTEFKAGDVIKATLVFEKAGEVTIDLPVKDAKGTEHHHQN